MNKNPVILRTMASLSVFVITTTVAIWVWSRYQTGIEAEYRETINTLGEHTRSRIWSNINSDIDQLQNFGDRLEFTDGEFFSYWQKDARQLVRLDSSIRFIEWIDSNMIIQDVVPLAPNRDVIKLDLTTVAYRVPGWRQSGAKDEMNITPWVDLIQGDQAFLIDSPVYIKGRFYGTITAGFDFTHDINQFFEDNPNYHIHLYDHMGQQFYCSDEESCANIEVSEAYQFNGLININSNRNIWWKMEFYPTASFFQNGTEFNSKISLFLSIFLGLTLSIMLFFIMKTNRQEKATKAINERLESLNETLENEKQRAEEASKVKSEFLSNMSHEIRTPLNIIQGLVHLVSDKQNENKQEEYFDLLKNSTANLLGLLNNILDIDRIEAGLVTVQNERFQPVRKIEALCEIFSRGFETKGVELRFETDEPRDVWVIGDEVKFTQIISNFVQNALKFTVEGNVTVYYEHYAQSGDTIEALVRIKDTGIGMPKHRLSKIFERFSQLDSGYRKKYSGTGLGLSINYELVKLLGGDIVVTSEEGKGTEFVVTLQFKEDVQTLEEKALLEEKIVTDFTGKHCLIVEDNQLNVLVVSKMLENLGFTWHAEYDGEKGVEAFGKQKFDLVIMDLHMPVMDGMTAAKEILKQEPGTPILMLSANVTKEAIRDAKEAGVSDYITKPVSKEKLVDHINQLLIHTT